MNHLPVIASVNSRLHADVTLIRLRRAKINCRNISVLFPAHVMPNAVGCWLPIAPHSNLRVGNEEIVCAGRFRHQLDKRAAAHDDGREVADLLIQSGVDPMGAHILAEKLGQGHSLLCVHSASDKETSIAWHVFRHSQADTIIVGQAEGARTSSPARAIPLIAPWTQYAA